VIAASALKSDSLADIPGSAGSHSNSQHETVLADQQPQQQLSQQLMQDAAFTDAAPQQSAVALEAEVAALKQQLQQQQAAHAAQLQALTDQLQLLRQAQSSVTCVQCAQTQQQQQQQQQQQYIVDSSEHLHAHALPAYSSSSSSTAAGAQRAYAMSQKSAAEYLDYLSSFQHAVTQLAAAARHPQ
jgi:hypothetical protein